MTDRFAALRDELMHLADPIYRLLHPAIEVGIETEPQAPGQPGVFDPAFVRHRDSLILQQNLGTVDNLRIVVSATAAATLLVTGLARGSTASLAMPIGNAGAGFLVAATADRTLHTFDLSIGPGQTIEALQIACLTTLDADKLIYVSAFRTRVLDDGTISAVNVLIGSYVNRSTPLAWPGSPIRSSLEGAGAVRYVLGADPVIGSEVVERVPAGARWELLSFSVRMIASGIVGLRLPILIFNDFVLQNYAHQYTNPGSAAGENRVFSWNQGVQQPTAITPPGFSLGPLLIGNRVTQGRTIETSTVNLDVGDNYQAPRYMVREWLDVP